MLESKDITPECNSESNDKCLFCAVPLPPNFTVVNGEITRLKRETADHDNGDDEDDCLPPTSCSFLSTEDPLLDKQLEVVFILKNILQISEKKLHQFLKQFGGQLHPEFWFQVCLPCGEAVQQFFDTLKEISELKKRLNRISKQLKGRIYNTKEAEGPEEGLTCIWEEIRAEVLKDFQEVHVSKTQRGSFREQENLDSEQLPASPGSSTGNLSCGQPSSDFEPEEKDNASSTSDFEPDDDSDSSKQTESEDEDYEPSQEKGGVTKRKPKPKSPPKHKESLQKKMTRPNANVHPEKTAVLSENRMGTKKPYYKCRFCPARSSHKVKMKMHMQLHEPSNEVECTICKSCQWLVKTSSLKHHLANPHHGKTIAMEDRDTEAVADEIPYYCDHCQMIYVRRIDLQNHFHVFHANQKELEVCSQPDCHRKFESRQLLAFHLHNMHPNLQTKEETLEEEGDQKCPHCELVFTSKLKADYHIAKLHKDILLTCTTCNVKTKCYSDYRRHMETAAHTSSPQPIICELCGTICKTGKQLKQHRRQYHYSELGLDPVKCEECGLIVISSIALKQHISGVHKKEKNFVCSFCGQTFAQRPSLQYHLRAFHSGPLGSSVVPDGKHFRLEKKDGNGVETWLCDFCSMTFANLMAVRTHLLKTHYDQLTHVCEGCNKKFCASLGLHQHRKRCAELMTKSSKSEEIPDKKFACQFCSKQFFSMGLRYNHERTIHKDRYSHVCQKCGKVYLSLGTLTLHQKKCAAAPSPSETVVDADATE